MKEFFEIINGNEKELAKPQTEFPPSRPQTSGEQEVVGADESKTCFWFLSLLSPFVGFGIGLILFFAPDHSGGFIPSGPIVGFLVATACGLGLSAVFSAIAIGKKEKFRFVSLVAAVPSGLIVLLFLLGMAGAAMKQH